MKPHRSPVRWALFAPVVLSLAALAGCGRSSPEPGKGAESAGKGTQPPAVAVDVTKPERQTVRQTIGQPGHIEAFEQTPIYARISGYVRKVHADIGEEIAGPEKGREGQLLAELAVPEMDAELEQKKALAAKAAEEIKQAEEIVKVAEAVHGSSLARVKEEEASRLHAKAEYDRWEAEYKKAVDLVRRSVLDQQTLDVTRFQREAARASRAKVEAKVQSAEAAVKESKARWEKAKMDVQVARARHRAAEADRAYTAAMLGYASIRAPYRGVVTERNINTGDFIQPATTGKGEPLFVVARTDSVRIFIEVPETDAVFVGKGAAARVRVRGLKGDELEGQLVRTSWGLRGRERTLRAEIDLENRGGRLRPGMYAFATITLEHKDAWTLPVAAVAVAEEQPYCVRVEGGKAVRTPVQLGLNDGKRVEVLRQWVRRPGGSTGGSWEPFTGREEVVAANPAALPDGQAVRPRDR